MLDSHLINEQEAKHHPKRNVISQCLGAANLDRLDIGKTRIEAQQGDKILLCSDGLHGELEPEQIEAVLNASNSPQQAVEELIDQANRRGGSDNITVIAIFAL
jgi:protein phosphatase